MSVVKRVGLTFFAISHLFAQYYCSDNAVMKESDDGMLLFDFTRLKDLDDWTEQSDTVREVGKSKGALVLQKTRIFQRAVFFSLLNPQANGACFVGFRTPLASLDLRPFSRLVLKARAQGPNSHYKVVLRHRGLDDEPHPTYENFFNMPLDKFEEISLYLDDFKPYYRGRQLNETVAGPLDKSNVTNLGFQIYGGVYSDYKQSGPASLEIDWIKAA